MPRAWPLRRVSRCSNRRAASIDAWGVSQASGSRSAACSSWKPAARPSRRARSSASAARRSRSSAAPSCSSAAAACSASCSFAARSCCSAIPLCSAARFLSSSARCWPALACSSAAVASAAARSRSRVASSSPSRALVAWASASWRCPAASLRRRSRSRRFSAARRAASSASASKTKMPTTMAITAMVDTSALYPVRVFRTRHAVAPLRLSRRKEPDEQDSLRALRRLHQDRLGRPVPQGRRRGPRAEGRRQPLRAYPVGGAPAEERRQRLGRGERGMEHTQRGRSRLRLRPDHCRGRARVHLGGHPDRPVPAMGAELRSKHPEVVRNIEAKLERRTKGVMAWRAESEAETERLALEEDEATPPLPIVAGQPEPQRGGARLPARGHLELAQDRRDVVGDGSLGEEEPLRYLRVAQALRD